MAQRRMFSLKIINSARFLKMPVDSQALYFHLGLHADDDGIVEAYPVMRSVGASDDNIMVLSARGFIRVLNEDLVTYIADWGEHNVIRADRKVDSIYKHLLLQIVPNAELVNPKPRSDVENNSRRVFDALNGGLSTDGIGKVRLGKDNKIVTETVTPAVYNFQEQIKLLEDNPRRDLNIVAFYLAERKPDLQNQAQFNEAIRRHVKPAGALKCFTNEQIIAGAKKAKRDYGDKGIDWTLETITKILTK